MLSKTLVQIIKTELVLTRFVIPALSRNPAWIPDQVGDNNNQILGLIKENVEANS